MFCLKLDLEKFASAFIILFILNQFSLSESKTFKLEFENSGGKQIANVKLEASSEESDSLINNPSLPESSTNKDIHSSNLNNEKPLFSGQRIVHLDLKGAAPKISYFSEFFPLIKRLGATGVIMEYEDMFPYSEIQVAASNAYTKDDIETVLKIAKDNELEVIPLIQTFGHLEFLLKLEKYKNMREVEKYPQVVCPTMNETFVVLKTMIDEILAMHPDAKYIHIGCDEVYHLGKCSNCLRTILNNKWSKQQLFLSHVITLTKYIHDKYPAVTPLTWDDEFRHISLQDLSDSGIGSLLEPVVWKYTPDIENFLPNEMWEKYATVFNNLWIATAFKGATGPDKYVTDISYHFKNHKAWMELVAKYNNKINFKGIILTGWQRYDHFSVLCELLPVGIPSLAFNLLYISSEKKNIKEVANSVRSILNCGPGFLNINVGSRCGFPGAGVYESAIKLNTISDQFKRITTSNVARGWFSDYNIEMGISNPSHVEEATFDLERFKIEFTMLQQDIIESMNQIYNSDTVSEWLDTNIKPLVKIFEILLEGRHKLLAKRVWSRRPYIKGETED